MISDAWLATERGLLPFLKEVGWALVLHPNSMNRATVVAENRGRGEMVEYQLEQLDERWPVTADFVYVRLHGRNDEHTYNYSDDELKPIAAALHSWRRRGIDVYAFLLNDDAAASMPRNARRLKELTHGLAREAVPDAPKQPRGIGAFFKAAPSPAASSGGGRKRERGGGS